MVIQHNLSAINTNRQYGIVNNSQAKSTEKLSSGYKINRAADDAAGLAISEKMRRQIRGLTQASENCQDGISLVQVADGALSEMTDIMQRMNELSVKAANGTLQVDDREAIQSEINALTKELRRIQDTTSFNEQLLFKGENIVDINADDYGYAPFDETTTISSGQGVTGKSIDFGRITEDNKNELAGREFTVHCSAGCNQVFTFKFVDGDGTQSSAVLDDHNIANNDRPDMIVTIDLNDPAITDGSSIAQKIYDLAKAKKDDIPDKAGSYDAYIGHANGIDFSGSKLTMFGVGGGGSGYIEANQLADADRFLIIQAGSEAGNIITINMYNIGPGKLGVSRLDVTTQAGASAAIGSVKGGITKLNEFRSYYGAMQNRMEHTIKNLDNIVENTTSAESQIRDTDMATEMVKYSNNNILLQAGTSMLAQANQSNQNVLSLLQ